MRTAIVQRSQKTDLFESRDTRYQGVQQRTRTTGFSRSLTTVLALYEVRLLLLLSLLQFWVL
ncbi:hypothetical protein [Scytonema sp. NUACC26]|uniref:hypothetical protein n=1 Tax=Scytonema sp. NUACC26 TaxID=3140176 RepID=UPI0038B2AFF2